MNLLVVQHSSWQHTPPYILALIYMSKRKLSRRQAWRVEKIQAERTSRADKKRERELEQVDTDSLSTEKYGLVIAHYGHQVEVETATEEGLGLGSSQRCHLRANLGSVVTGDRVIWRQGDSIGVIEAVLDRRSELSRPNSQNQSKIIAANIDRLVIVVAPYPEPHTNLIDRYLSVAEHLGLAPLLLINKTDMINADNQQDIQYIQEFYQQLGYPVLQLSATLNTGIEPLREYLKQGTNVFVGQSGVGKSSLINTLIPGLETRVGELSASRQKGTHTTTTAQLFHFPGGGQLIDSPGIREFGLWPIPANELLWSFVECRPYLGMCRFRDCKHQQEPGCAIQQALADGAISHRRFDSYYHILNSFTD